MSEALDRAIKMFGKQGVFASALGITSPSISEWRKRKVPPARCAQIEHLTGGEVTKEELRPDLWTPKSQKAA